MRAALAEREAIGDYFGRHSSLISLAELYADMKRWEAAREHADRALAQAEEAGHVPGIADALRTRATIALSSGNIDPGRADLARLEGEFPDDWEGPLHRLLRARLAFADGEAGSARALLEPVIENGPAAARIDALYILGLNADEIEEARRYWRQALELAREHHERARVGRILMASARRELAAGNLDEARASAASLAADFGEWQGVAELSSRLGSAQAVD